MRERVQKILARAGFGSRRQIEEWIRGGRVKINGQLAQLGDCIEKGDVVHIDGERIRLSDNASPLLRVIAYHKPEGKLCTRSDPEKRPTIFADLPRLKSGRWVIVGRLDINSSGLILLTTDGELANRLMHPSRGIEREYAVRVLGDVDDRMLDRLRHGVKLDDGAASFDSIRDAGGQGANHWYHVVLHEGRNREVRRLWESQDIKVSRLIRVRFGPISLGRGLRPGKWSELSDQDVTSLLRLTGLADKIRTVKKTGRRHSGMTNRHVPRKRLRTGNKV
jgi:23S rRNA pseudouridine2605 synthase